MAWSKKTSLVFTTGVIFLIVVLVVLVIANTARQQNGAGLKPQVSIQEKKNMMVDESERTRIREDFNRRVGRRSNTNPLKDAHFTYEFSPAFKERIKNLKPRSDDVKAVSTLCNLGEVPSSVYVYDLRNHWIVGESQALALEYGVDSIAYSLPTETTTYQYLFITPDNMMSFTQYESSGIYTYNKTSLLPDGQLNGEGLRRYANEMLAQHKLNSNLSVPQISSRGNVSTFVYRQNLLDFMLVDEASIQSFFDQENCSVSDSDIMGLISVGVKSNAEIIKVNNNTRTQVSKYKMTTIPIEQALVEYKDAQPFDQLVYPSDATVDTRGQVVIDAAVIAYYDVGPNFAQNLYVPVYIAHGFAKSTTGQDVQILTFFPAVSAEELASKGVISSVPLPGDRSTQQQGMIGFATPTPHAPPVFQPKQGEIGYSGPGCPGNQIDYLVSCSVEGSVICRGNFTGGASSDGLQACKNGCSGKVAVVDVTGGTNPCGAIMEQSGVVTTAVYGAVPRQRIAPKGQVSCVITACPM